MTDYLFSKMSCLLTIPDDLWFRHKELLRRKSYDLRLHISIYKSGKYYVILKGLKIDKSSQHLTASVLFNTNGYYIEHKISIPSETIEQAEALLLERLIFLKTVSYYGAFSDSKKRLAQFGDFTIGTSSAIEIRA